MINGASRFIERQENRPKRPSVLKRPNVSNRGRNWRRFQRGPGQLLLIKDGIVTFGAEDEERDWTGIVRQIKPGTHKVEYDESQWQVIAQPIHSSTADLVVAVLPWSPSVRLIRALLLYQVLVSLGVLAVALVVESGVV